MGNPELKNENKHINPAYCFGQTNKGDHDEAFGGNISSSQSLQLFRMALGAWVWAFKFSRAALSLRRTIGSAICHNNSDNRRLIFESLSSKEG